jgi:hypothetical protein
VAGPVSPDVRHSAEKSFLFKRAVCNSWTLQAIGIIAGEDFGKETLDEIEPGAMGWRAGEFEAMCRLLRSRLWSLWRCARNDCRGLT